ncbi:Ion transport protein-domain-containing protein [Melampsora americana]|nr:Ion transport protein-domain-containing protein [Melampsora americana]
MSHSPSQPGSLRLDIPKTSPKPPTSLNSSSPSSSRLSPLSSTNSDFINSYSNRHPIHQDSDISAVTYVSSLQHRLSISDSQPTFPTSNDILSSSLTGTINEGLHRRSKSSSRRSLQEQNHSEHQSTQSKSPIHSREQSAVNPITSASSIWTHSPSDQLLNSNSLTSEMYDRSTLPESSSNATKHGHARTSSDLTTSTISDLHEFPPNSDQHSSHLNPIASGSSHVLGPRINSKDHADRLNANDHFKRKSGSKLLNRRNTLSVAANVIRRTSVRVVNLTGNVLPDNRPTHRGTRALSGIELTDRTPALPNKREFPHQRLSGSEDEHSVVTVEDASTDTPPHLQLRGHTLGIFGPRNRFRLKLFHLFKSSLVEPLIFFLIILDGIVLTIQSSKSVWDSPRPIKGYFHTWEDDALFFLFCVFTFEMIARIIVSGFILNDDSSATPASVMGIWNRKLPSKARFGWQRSNAQRFPNPHPKDRSGSSLGSSSKIFFQETPFRSGIKRQQKQLINQTAYLRHSWNRTDFVAIVSFWISFVLSTIGWESRYQLYVFRALSVLRLMRLLTITSGTTVILNSLKRASPLLVNVLFFVFFAAVLFSIVGVQSFKGSYERYCVWIDPTHQSNYTFPSQSCGGHYDAVTGLARGFVQNATGLLFSNPKGYLCPQGQLCMETGNPNNGTQNFDNVAGAAMQVIVIASANTWANMMYSLMDAEYFLSSLFFVFCLLVLNFWLLNILVAVITNTFAEIMDETKCSAFASSSGVTDATTPKKSIKPSLLRKVNDWLDPFWVLAVFANFVVQASRTASMSPKATLQLDRIELYFTMAFVWEILQRFLGYLPNQARQFVNGVNMADASLAIITIVIQIPLIKRSTVYPWLTFFQIARFYRVTVAFPRTGALLQKLRGSFNGLMNMILFLMGINFFAALLAVQLLRGVIPKSDETEMTFYQMWNAFLAMYQIFSSENWTTVLYSAMAAQAPYRQAFISGIMISAWFLFANFVLLQMFIAVISEGFAVAEEQKRKEQVRALIDRSRPQVGPSQWYSRFNPYNYIESKHKSVAVDNPPANSVLPMQKRMVRAFTLPRDGNGEGNMSLDRKAFVTRARKVLNLDNFTEKTASNSTGPDAAGDADLDKSLDYMSMTARQRQQIYVDKRNQRRALEMTCQKLVEPAYGERLLGQRANKIASTAFEFTVLAAIAGSVIVAAIATPVYKQHPLFISLGMFFVLEFLIKIIADVLITLITDVIASLVFKGTTSRFTRSLKAFRALRLINMSQSMRETFYNVLVLGFGNLVDASVLTVMYIVPFAVWGQNIFAGLLYSCNDSSPGILGKAQCVGEYVGGAPASFNFLMPRVWNNPYVYSFDSFRSAVLILFEIISLEGWINVMVSLMSITGKDQQPSQDATQFNAIYSLIYNLFGATVVLTLFLAVIINNFLQRSGSAFLTTEQQQWINLRRLILRQQPSKRPRARPRDPIRDWCYSRATQKHGWWSRMMTGLYVFHVVILMTYARSNSDTKLGQYRDMLYLLLASIYLADVLIKFAGIGWISFRQNGWNLYDVVVIFGTFATTTPIVLYTKDISNVIIQFQKFFLVAIAFKLVVKNNALNQLFKTAISSLPSITNLLGLWAVLFIVWGILFVENFSLTKMGPSSLTRNSNYQSLANALVMLATQSTGIDSQYTIEAPYCVSSPNFLFNDCGSAEAAYTLFISWNVISMYIILNMFTGLVVDNFAYVFQLYGKVKAIDREEVRRFKKVWSEFDLNRTGYLQRDQFIPFFARLTGAFNVSIYPPELRLHALLEACQRKPESVTFKDAEPKHSDTQGPTPRFSPHAPGLDLHELNSRLSFMNRPETRARRNVFNHLYQEALLSEKPGRGLSFTAMMLLLAHRKLIEDDQALQLEELLQRKAKKEKVDDLVNFDRVHGLFRTLLQRRKFKKTMALKKQGQTQGEDIFVTYFLSSNT